jgi:transposase
VPCLPEFRQQMVELVRSTRAPEDLARESEPTAQSIWSRVHQAVGDGGVRRDGGVTSPEREEPAKLRRGNHRLRQERDILAKAAFRFIEGFYNRAKRYSALGYLAPLEHEATAMARNE